MGKSRGCIMPTSVPEVRAEAGSVNVSDERLYAHDVRTTVARILVGLPFALTRLMEATAFRVSRWLTSKGHRAA